MRSLRDQVGLISLELEMVGHKIEQENEKSKVIDVERSFNFRPYTFTPRGIVELQLYADLGGSTMSNYKVPVKILTWLTIILQLYFIS